LPSLTRARPFNKEATVPDEQVQVGELRVTSAGNIYMLEKVQGPWRIVKRLGRAISLCPLQLMEGPLWDECMPYRWHASQWEEGIPLFKDALCGNTQGYAHFGINAP
jgi:hypothetical protein